MVHAVVTPSTPALALASATAVTPTDSGKFTPRYRTYSLKTNEHHSGISDAFCGADCFELAGLCMADFEATNTINRPKATHVPWKPTVHHDPHFKPSYVIDNGERAPNQVWS
jgi:hypothetical protein